MASQDISSRKVTIKLLSLEEHVCTLNPMIPKQYHSSTRIAVTRMPKFRFTTGKIRKIFDYICIKKDSERRVAAESATERERANKHNNKQ